MDVPLESDAFATEPNRSRGSTYDVCIWIVYLLVVRFAAFILPGTAWCLVASGGVAVPLTALTISTINSIYVDSTATIINKIPCMHGRFATNKSLRLIRNPSF